MYDFLFIYVKINGDIKFNSYLPIRFQEFHKRHKKYLNSTSTSTTISSSSGPSLSSVSGTLYGRLYRNLAPPSVYSPGQATL